LGELKRLEFPKEVLGDLMRAFVHLDVLQEGPATAVLCTIPGAAENEPLVIFLNREGPAYRLLDVSQGDQAALAWEILDLVNLGQGKEAGTWLSFIASLHDRNPSFPDLSSKPIFKELPPGPPWGADDIRFAAAVKLIKSDSRTMYRRAAPFLLDWWRTASDLEKKSRLGIPLAGALAALNRNDELLEVTKYLYLDSPYKQSVAELRAVALTRDGKPTEAVNLLQSHPYSGSGEVGWSRLLAKWFAGAGRFEEAIKAIDRVVASGRAEARDYSLRGWYELFRSEPNFRLIDDRQFMLKLVSGKDAEVHVLACLLAGAGRTSEAVEAFKHYLELRKGAEPDSSIWLIHGMLAERFGLFETARADFRRVKPARELYPGSSLFALARKHLARLK
jgi:Flp pilus assembly protein TadD